MARLPQDPSDAFDWEQWFADPRDFRDCRFDPETGWVAPPGRNPSLMVFGGAGDE